MVPSLMEDYYIYNELNQTLTGEDNKVYRLEMKKLELRKKSK